MPQQASSATKTSTLLSAAATTNSTLVRGAAATLKRLTGHNARTSPVYLKLYDKVTAPTVGTDTVRKTYYLPASTAFVFDLDDYFGQGIGYGLTTAAAAADTGAVAAGDILCLNVDYL